MFKFLAKVFAFLTSKRVSQAIDVVDRAVDVARDVQKKLPKQGK